MLNGYYELCGRIYKDMIKDSGNRTEFETGAVRDIQEGKGRCDLLPIDAMPLIFETLHGDQDSRVFMFNCLSGFVKTGEIEGLIVALDVFVSDHKAFDSLADMLLEVSIHFEEGAKKYGERNWEKGIPTQRYIDSAVRHYLKWLRGDDDERHDRAFCWNIICCIWTCIHHPDLNDYGKGVDNGK